MLYIIKYTTLSLEGDNMQSSASAYHQAGQPSNSPGASGYKALPHTLIAQPDVLLNYYHHQHPRHSHAFAAEALLQCSEPRRTLQHSPEECASVERKHSPSSSSSSLLVTSHQHHSPTSSTSSGKNVAVGCTNNNNINNNDLIPTSSTITINNNEVRNVMLYGIPIVSLVMDGQERLCLAQISNTLLKQFSYNEIHNRSVK